MAKVTHDRFIGIDVSRDWLDVHRLPDGQRHRMPNDDAGHLAVVNLARNRRAIVCFEATGGQEWRLWFYLEDAGVEARQVPPAQVKAFARSLGIRAKTDRIDSELIARFLVFRPEAGRTLPAEHLRFLRALTTRRAQVVEMRKRLQAQIRAHRKSGTAELFEDVDVELNERSDVAITELESRISELIGRDSHLADIARILRSVPGIGSVANSTLIAELPGLGTLTGEEAAALTGLAPVAQDCGTLRGKRAIAGGRRALRHVLFQAALFASHHNLTLKAFADRLCRDCKTHKVIVTAVARKLVIVANALCKKRREWEPLHPGKIQVLENSSPPGAHGSLSSAWRSRAPVRTGLSVSQDCADPAVCSGSASRSRSQNLRPPACAAARSSRPRAQLRRGLLRPVVMPRYCPLHTIRGERSGPRT